MTDLFAIRSTITSGCFTNDELNSIADAVRFARSQLGRRNTRALRTGDNVKFTSTRSGAVFQGTVEKIKIKYVLVNTPQGRYNVPASMLEAV